MHQKRDATHNTGLDPARIVNLKAAKAIGLTIPKSILLQADKVIRLKCEPGFRRVTC